MIAVIVCCSVQWRVRGFQNLGGVFADFGRGLCCCNTIRRGIGSAAQRKRNQSDCREQKMCNELSRFILPHVQPDKLAS